MGKGELLQKAGWPQPDPSLMKSDTVEIAIQVNGKVKTRLVVPAGLEEQAVAKLPETNENIRKFVPPEAVQKVIWVRDKLANFIVRPS